MSQLRNVKYVSRKQLRANRRNAQQSTGPRTGDAKARSALNAVDHGIFCKELLMPGEDPRELEAFQNQLLDALKPRDALEASIAAQYVEAKWRMRRIRAAERDAHHLEAATIETFDGGPFVELRLRMCDMPKSSCFDDVEPSDDPASPQYDPRARERLREQRCAARGAIVPVSATMARSFHEEGQGSFERLSRYQYRLEISADRALRQLRQLRKDRECVVVDPDDKTTPEPAGVVASATMCPTSPNDANAPVQNEPISDATSASPAALTTCEPHACDASRAMKPEIFHPARLGTQDVVAEATTPREKPRRR